MLFYCGKITFQKKNSKPFPLCIPLFIEWSHNLLLHKWLELLCFKLWCSNTLIWIDFNTLLASDNKYNN